MRPQLQTRATDEVIHTLAEVQHGIVSRGQLLGEGVGKQAVKHRVKLGRLRPIHRGVYLVGPGTPTREGRWMAAVLACGEGAILSHRAARVPLGDREPTGPD